MIGMTLQPTRAPLFSCCNRTCRLTTSLAKPHRREHIICSAMATPQLEFYDDDHSLFCSKVRVALHWKKVPFTSLPVPCGSSSPEYRKISPLGKIPALVVTEEGQQPVTLTETEVMIEWLEERFPAPTYPALLPQHHLLRAQARILARFHDLYLEPALRKLYPQVAPANRSPATVQAIVDELQERLTQLEILLLRADAVVQELAPTLPSSTTPTFPLGTLTLAECGYPPNFLYLDIILEALGVSLVWPQRILDWRKAIEATEAVQAVNAVLRPAGVAWLNGKLGV